MLVGDLFYNPVNFYDSSSTYKDFEALALWVLFI